MMSKKEEIELQKIWRQERKILFDSILSKIVEADQQKFLSKIKQRFDILGLEIPKIEVRYEHLSVDGSVHVGSRALPTLLNAATNVVEGIMELLRLAPSKKRNINILHDVSGILRPSRMTLLLGPPSSGKTTLLRALAGKFDTDLKVTGRITYCGHELTEFVPEKTSAYISQNDLHLGEMTVRETLDFAGRSLGVGTMYDLLKESSRRETEAGIQPDLEVDAFMNAIAINGLETCLITDYVIKMLGLDICADTIVGDDMRRGISGGEKKRTTIGEMLVGPAKVLLMDEISTGLDSTTAFRICKYMSEMAHIMDLTTIISLQQPTPETYELFDDIILLSEGQIVYQGPRENILEFFEHVGFKCPDRKAVADFLQEVISAKDQEQYWSKEDQPYRYFSIPEFAQVFWNFKIGQCLASNLNVPFNKAKTHRAALVKEKYGISYWELLRTSFSRRWLLMKRNALYFVFRIAQLTFIAVAVMTAFFRTTMHHKTVIDGEKYLGAIFFSLSNFVFSDMAEISLMIMELQVFYKQRDFLFYPAWIYGLPICILQIPLSLMESALWTSLTYYTIGYAPSAGRFFCQWLAYFCIQQMALSIFRLIAAVGRIIVVANAICLILMLATFVLGGYIIAKDDIGPWAIWVFYLSPMMYGQQALVINEFLDERWNNRNSALGINEPTVGKAILATRGFFNHQYLFWTCIGALIGFSFLFNFLYIVALTYLNAIGDSKSVVQLHDDTNKKVSSGGGIGGNTASISCSKGSSSDVHPPRRGMVLTFQPLTITFNNVNYYVDTPSGMRSLGYQDDHLQLLRDVSGAFRPGILTALVGTTGAGKTTLMDVLAGRKTRGYIEGNISVSGYPKNQATFARVCGYCEQTDIHSPHVTVYESLMLSAWLRIPSEVDEQTRKMFIEEVMELIELKPISDALVGIPGVSGLSIEQRKRFTIAVELVANPSIIFMDEPTSGLDARAAAIVMRTVRNTVDTGRTVVCTIHQPSVDIFEAFDELLLMKTGGQIIYAGPLGHHSHDVIEFFEAIPGVPKIRDGYNPATWMLDITSPQAEFQLGVDFAECYANSSLYQKNQETIRELNTQSLTSLDLYFSSKYAQPFIVQFKACFWKQHRSYWKNPPFNAVRFLEATLVGLMLGVMFWNKGGKITKMQDLMNLLGFMYSALSFLQVYVCINVQAVVASERTVFYRERAAGMYSALPFALAQVAIEAIYLATLSFPYALFLYSMIGFEWTIRKFFSFYYFMFMCFMYYVTYGMMLISLIPRQEISAVVMCFSVTLWNLFAGFLLPKPQIPIWCRWYYWASPVAWTMYGLVTSQVGDKNCVFELPEVGNFPVKVFLKQTFDYDYDFLPFVAAAHLCWVLLFFLVFVCGIKFLNFQNR